MKFSRSIVAIAILSTLVGCSSTQFQDKNHKNLESKVSAEQEASKAVSVVRHTSTPYISAVAVDYRETQNGTVSLEFNAMPIYQAIKTVAEPIGYSVQFAPGVDDTRTSSTVIKALNSFAALREIAYSAGLVIIANHDKKTLVLANEGGYTYRLPMELLKNRKSNFSASNTPSGTGGGSSGGSTGGSSGGSTGGSSNSGSGSAGQFTVSGASTYTSDKLINYIRKISGVTIEALPEFGMVSVHGNALQLRRANTQLEMYVKDAMTQVEVEVSIIDVSLNRDFQYGIDWNKVLPGGVFGNGAPATFSAAQSGNVVSPSITASFGITPTIAIKALDKLTDVNVISKPKLMAQNHVPEVLFTGTSQPYLGSTSTAVVTGGGTTSGSTLSYALDGVSLSIEANVIDSSRVEIMLLSVVNNISSFATFAGGLTAPISPVKQSMMQVIAENGRTIIVGGTRVNSKQSADSGVPFASGVPLIGSLFGSNKLDNNKEVVLLLNAKIIPPKKIDLIIGESI